MSHQEICGQHYFVRPDRGPLDAMIKAWEPMTPKLILVATDMSERSDRALARASQLARQTGAALHILHVVDEELPATIAEAEIASAKVNLNQLTSVGRGLRGLEARLEVVPGDPWRTIVQKANLVDADLIVLGTHRRRGLSGMFEGTTIERVARTSARPVLRVMAPALEAYREVLVAVDFSECARGAARLAFALAPTAAVTLVHAYHIPYKGLTVHIGPEGDMSKAEKDEIESGLSKQIATFLREVDATGRDVRSFLAEGTPDHVLRQQIAARNADLLCLGLHSRSWLQDSILGSTAWEMLADCPCDLLLAPLERR
ncbi:universal stress protein [Solirhodobacter olei]|uniref:universal stress protein n=1 Tax=Solirhodobacter olei TaxID=2493082 RepID=UPI000FDBEF1A|nr:universal stress protein [Solirhodobacter olei]